MAERRRSGNKSRHLHPGVIAVLAFGLLVRLAIAWEAGPTGDNRSFAAAVEDLRRYGLDFYSYTNAYDAEHPFAYRNYSYPPAYLPVFLVADSLAGAGLPFWKLARVVPVIADLALAWIVQANLGTRRAWPRALAASAIALGPSFIASSALEAQVDAVAILPGVIAVLFWQRNSPRRALYCGLLIGLGAAMKTIPILLVLALLPTTKSRRETFTLFATTATVPTVALAPFAIADWNGTISTLGYAGWPGAGGLSLVFQPSLADHYLGDYDLSSAIPLLQHWGWLLTVIGVGAAATVAYRARLAAVPAAALLMLALYATSMNWYPQYLAWGLPFLLLCGFIVPVLLVQAMVALPLALSYRGRLGVLGEALPPGRMGLAGYVLLMDALWLAAAVGAVVLARRAAQASHAAPSRSVTTGPGVARPE